MNVIGFGNDWRGDDAVGLEVARRLGGTAMHGEPIGLVEAVEGTAEVALVDAVFSGASPGTVHRFDASSEPLPARLFGGTSTHALGVADAVELARSLGRLPARTLVYGIEGSSFGLGKTLTPAVEAAVSRVVEELRGA